MKTLKYGLRHKKENVVLTLNRESNGDAQYCGEDTCTLSTDSDDPQWLVEEPERAEYIRLYGRTNWYNTSTDNPSHRYNISDLEVVQVEVIVNTTPVPVSLPSFEDYMQMRIETHQKYPYDQANMRQRLEDYRKDQKTMTPEDLNQKYSVVFYELLQTREKKG